MESRRERERERGRKTQEDTVQTAKLYALPGFRVQRIDESL